MRKIKTDEQAKKLREQLDETATFHGVQIVLMVVLSLLIAILIMNFWARVNVRMWLLLSDALKNCADDYYRCEMQQSYFDESKSTKIYYEMQSDFLNSKGYSKVVIEYEKLISNAVCEDKAFDASEVDITGYVSRIGKEMESQAKKRYPNDNVNYVTEECNEDVEKTLTERAQMLYDELSKNYRKEVKLYYRFASGYNGLAIEALIFIIALLWYRKTKKVLWKKGVVFIWCSAGLLCAGMNYEIYSWFCTTVVQHRANYSMGMSLFYIIPMFAIAFIRYNMEKYREKRLRRKLYEYEGRQDEK